MTHFISFQSMGVLIDGHDSEGRLVLADGQLAAVLVRLDGEHHTTDLGKWHLEAGFGKCAVHPSDALLWGSLDAARTWVQERLRGRAPGSRMFA